MKKPLFLHLMLLAILTNHLIAQSVNQNTWTFTYLKANKGQKDNLRVYLEKNWFVMDNLAVKQGLFNDYELIENANKDENSEWDFIVAVEYFTSGTYADIAEKFEIIRKEHKTVNVNNLGFKDLGKIVKSETIQKKSDIKSTAKCTGKQYEILKPFLGVWDEYSVENDKENLFGKLEITLNAEGCNLAKRFVLYNKNFTYLTHGYFDPSENSWIETFTFNNGGYAKYKWVETGKDVVMERIASSSKSDVLNRNRWTNITSNTFDILEERSSDAGKTWKIFSTTRLRKK